MTAVVIVCPIHGEFSQTPNAHLQGSGCRWCTYASRGETEVFHALRSTGIPFLYEATFPTCKYKRLLRFDFFVPSLKLLIEFDGEQHEKPEKFPLHNNESLHDIAIREAIKTTWAAQNGYTLVRIPYTCHDISGEIDRILANHLHLIGVK